MKTNLFHYTRFIYYQERLAPAEKPNISESLKDRERKGELLVAKRRREAEELKKYKDELFEGWVNETKNIERKKVDVEYQLLTGLQNQSYAKEAALMARLIKEYWGEAKARELYQRSWKGQEFSLDVMLDFFKKGKDHPNNSTEKLGFYYWKEKGKWYVYNDKSGSSDMPIGPYLHQHLSILERNFNSSDIEFLVPKDKRAQIVGNVRKGVDFVENTTRTSAQKYLYGWFMKKPEGRMVTDFPDRERGLLVLAYGAEALDYGYTRFRNKIYYLGKNGIAGFIKMEGNKLGGFENDKKGAALLKTEVLDNMSVDQVMRENVAHRLKAAPGAATAMKPQEKLLLIAGEIAALNGIPKRVEASKIHENYLNIIEKKLKERLKDEYPNNYQDLVATKMQNIEAQIEEAKKDPILKKALDKNEKEALIISIDSKDKVKVTTANRGLFRNLKKALKKAEEKAIDVKDLAGKTTDELNKKIRERFGEKGTVISWFMNTFLDMKKGITKLWSGGNAPITAMVLGMFGIKISKGILGAKKIEKPEELASLFERRRKRKRTEENIICERHPCSRTYASGHSQGERIYSR